MNMFDHGIPPDPGLPERGSLPRVRFEPTTVTQSVSVPQVIGIGMAVLAAIATLSLGIWWVIPDSYKFDPDRSDRMITECVARGGTVITDSQGRLDQCIGGNP